MIPTQPSYHSRPSSSTGRHACSAIASRSSSESVAPRTAENSFSARNRIAISLSRRVSSSDSPARNGRRALTRRHIRSSSACFSSTRLRFQSRSQPISRDSLARVIQYRMVSVVQFHPQSSAAALEPIAAGVSGEGRTLIARALEFAEPLYAGQVLSTGEPVWPHALGLGASLAAVGIDPAARAAGVLFAAPKHLGGVDRLHQQFGAEIASLASGVEKLYRLRAATRRGAEEQNEILPKMVLGMVEDVRVVLIRLASRTQTLRWFAKNPAADRDSYARETLDIYAPLANRLGVWQLKWELEDLSFRFLDPDLYRKIAKMLEETRSEREQYIRETMKRLDAALAAAGVKAEIAGRPKHI